MYVLDDREYRTAPYTDDKGKETDRNAEGYVLYCRDNNDSNVIINLPVANVGEKLTEQQIIEKGNKIYNEYRSKKQEVLGMKKMILVILLLFVVNCNLIYGKQNYENTLWRELTDKKEKIVIEKITEITGAKIKAVYFDSRCDDFDDKDIWQDGLLYIKINLAIKH